MEIEERKISFRQENDEESNEEENDVFVEDVSVEIKEDILFDQQSSSDDSDEEDEPQEDWKDVQEDWSPNWLPEYKEKEGPSRHLPGYLTEAEEFFTRLFDIEVLNLLVEQTNLYADQFFARNPELQNNNYYRQWKSCGVEEFKAYIGILIHMGLVRLPRMQSHWEVSEHSSCCFCPNVMSRQKFTLIHKFFHIVDNERLNRDDKLCKIRPLINLLVSNYQRYYVLSKNLSIDERMVKYTGRLSFRQYIRNKPIKLGIKVWVLADSQNGYVYNLEVYCGAREKKSTNLAQDVVSHLVEGLQNRGHILCFDSYYTSVPLAKSLSIRGFGCLGMLKANRKFIPTIIKNPPPMKEKEGYFQKLGNLMCFVFKDKREVRMLTNVYGISFENNENPQALNDYNLLMRGVDRSNQMISYYHFKHKSIKWYRTLFISILETTIANAYQLYRCRFPLTGMNLLKFRESLATDLVQDFLTQQNEKIRLGPSKSIIIGLHEIGIQSQRNCCICSTSERRKTTIYYCIDCNKSVCPVRCFYLLHTNLKVHVRKKVRNIEQ